MMDPVNHQFLCKSTEKMISAMCASKKSQLISSNLFSSHKEIVSVRNTLLKQFTQQNQPLSLQRYTFKVFSKTEQIYYQIQNLVIEIERLISGHFYELSEPFDPVPESVKSLFGDSIGRTLTPDSPKTVGMLPSENLFIYAFSKLATIKEKYIFAFKTFNCALVAENITICRLILEQEELASQNFHKHLLDSILKRENCSILSLYLMTSPYVPLIHQISPLFPTAVRMGHEPLITYMITHGVDPNVWDKHEKTALHYCVEDNDINMAVKLLNIGAEGDWPDGNHVSPFIEAYERKHWDMVELIYSSLNDDMKEYYFLNRFVAALFRMDIKIVKQCLEKGVKLNHSIYNEMTPLGITCSIGSRSIARLLLNAGASPNALDANMKLPWAYALETEKDEIFSLLFDFGGNVNGFSVTEKGILSPLQAVAQKGKTTLAMELINRGVSLNSLSRTDKQFTALQYAMIERHWEIALLLIERGASPHRGDPDFSPIRLALRGDQYLLFTELVRRGARVSFTTEDLKNLTTVHVFSTLALWEGPVSENLGKFIEELIPHFLHHNRIDLVRYLLSFNSYSDVKNEYGNNLLHLVCKKGLTDIFAGLDLSRFDLNECNDRGYSPFYLALLNKNYTICEMLYLNGINLSENIWTIVVNIKHRPLMAKLEEMNISCDAENAYGETALHHSCLGNDPSVVAYLLNQGANVHKKDRNGYTPLHLAAKSSSPDIVALLLARGADPNAVNKAGYPPLILAIKSKSLEKITLLVDAGADVNAVYPHNDSPLMSACDLGDTRIVQFLIDRGAKVDTFNLFGSVPGNYTKNPVIRRQIGALDDNLTIYCEILNHLSHRFALPIDMRYKDRSVKFRGNTAFASIESHYASLKKFFNENPLSKTLTDLEKLKLFGVFDTMISPSIAATRAKRISSGEMNGIPSGFIGHMTGLFFFRHLQSRLYYMIESNRGAKTEHYGLKMKRIHAPENLPDVIESLHSLSDESHHHTSEKYRELLSRLGISKDPHESIPVFDHIPQKGGYCSHTNIKPIVPEAAILAIFLNRGEALHEARRKARVFYKSFTAFDRNYILRQFISLVQNFSLPKEMMISLFSLRQIYQKISKDPRIDPDLVFNFKEACYYLHAQGKLIKS